MKKSVRRGVIIVIVLVALGFIFIPRLKWFSAGSGEVPVNKEVPRAGALQVTGVVAEYTESSNGIPAMGTMLANEEVELVAEIVGKVRRIYFQEGSHVKKGQLLLKVDDADLQAQLVRAEFQRKLLSEKLERQRILLKRESISREAFDQLQTDYNVLEADIELLNVKISRTEIRAPFDGVMGFRYVSEGSYVQPNSKIATIVDNSVLKFEFSVSEKYAARNLKGKKVNFRITGSDKNYTAEIYAIDPLIDVKTRMILLRARFNNSQGELMPGMFAKGNLVLDGKNEYIAIPTEAIVPEMEGKRVWLVENGKAKSVKVETESRDAKYVEVISGVQSGDTVLTGGLMQLREGMKVEVALRPVSK